MTRLTMAALLIGLIPCEPAVADVGALLDGMPAAYARVDGYTSRFVRQERIGGDLHPREEALLKYLRPGRMYLRWVAGPPTGRELLFVEGRDAGQVLVHERGAFAGLFTLMLAPDSPWVLRRSRHPVTDLGLGRLIDLIADNVRRARGRGELTVLDGGLGREGDRLTQRLELRLPRDPGRGYYCYRASLAVDRAWGLPVAATIYDWDDRMVAEYAYLDLRLNAALTPIDFDTANPEYGFPRWRLRW